MKNSLHRIMFALVVILMLPLAASAQSDWKDYRNSVRLGLGIAPYEPFAFESNADIYFSSNYQDTGYGYFWYPTSYECNRYYWPAINASIARRYTRVFELEGTLSYFHVRQDERNIYDDHVTNRIRCHYMAISATARFYWLNTKHFSAYSAVGLGLGVALKNEHSYDPGATLNLNLTLFGGQLTYGRMIYFAEAGVQCNGCFNVGVGYRF